MKKVIKAAEKKKKAQLKRIEKILSKKVVSKRVVKPQQVSIKISEPAPKKETSSSFFKSEWEETKKSLFLK